MNNFSRPLLNVCTTIPKYTNGMCESSVKLYCAANTKLKILTTKVFSQSTKLARHTLTIDFEVCLASLQASIYIEGRLVGS